MQKEQKPLVDAMLRTSFREVVWRSIAILLMKKVGQRFDDMVIDAPSHITAEQKMQLKRQYAQELLKDDRVKKDAQHDLDDISRMKSDVVAEILRQYSLDKNLSESTYYHDRLCFLFDECMWNIRYLVKKGKWKELGV